MRISHKRRKPEPKRIFFYNEGIASPDVFVLDDDGKSLGAMKTAAAIRIAREKELDLVLINPKATPPVAKIIDYGQYRYLMEKEERLKKAHQHVTEVKGVRLSLNIGQHDLEIRKKQAINFLDDGDKVKVEIILRGRELQNVKLAFDVIKNFIVTINAERAVRQDQTADKQGNKITAIIAKA